jgi:hypothetical protein
VRRRRTEAAAVEGDYGRVLPQVKPGVVGLDGLEPAASSLSVVMGRWPTLAHENGSAVGPLGR